MFACQSGTRRTGRKEWKRNKGMESRKFCVCFRSRSGCGWIKGKKETRTGSLTLKGHTVGRETWGCTAWPPEFSSAWLRFGGRQALKEEGVQRETGDLRYDAAGFRGIFCHLTILSRTYLVRRRQGEKVRSGDWRLKRGNKPRQCVQS